jgi:hypothetical protein
MPRRNLALDRCVGCGRDSDMVCPLVLSLADVLTALHNAGYVAHFNDIMHGWRVAHCRCAPTATHEAASTTSE